MKIVFFFASFAASFKTSSPDDLDSMLKMCRAHMGRTTSHRHLDAEGLALRKCLIREAQSALSCNHGATEEEYCVGSAEAAFTRTKNKGWPGGMSFLTPLPTFMDIACQGAFPVTCNASAQFRSITGICNNLEHQLWGAASTKIRRYIGADYADGKETPRGGWESSFNHCVTGRRGKGDKNQLKDRRSREPPKSKAHQKHHLTCKANPRAILPNPRFVSFNLMTDRNVLDSEATHLFVQFGQYVCHDIALFPEEETEKDCCDVPEQDGCFPIQVPCEDPHFLQPEFKPRRVRRSADDEEGEELEDQNRRRKGSRRRRRRKKSKRRVKKSFFDPWASKDGFEVARQSSNVRSGSQRSFKSLIGLEPWKEEDEFTFVDEESLERSKRRGRDGKESARFDPKSGKLDEQMTREVAKAKAAGIIPEGSQMPRVSLVLRTQPADSPEKRGFLDPGYCLEFRRSIAFCEERTVKRDQLNGNTAFLDNSNIYGNEFSVFRKLRLFSRGKLKASQRGKNLPVQESRCVSGDPRAAEMPALASYHTLFVREHNRVAEELSEVCCQGNDDFVFQRARRIVIAEFQNIIFKEFLPQLFGPRILKNYRLEVEGRTTYDPSVNPTIRNAFSTAAFRFGHSMVWNNVSLVDDKGRWFNEYSIKDTYFDDTIPLLKEGKGVDYILNGMARQPGGAVDLHVVEDLTNFLFVNGSGLTGADLIARNIQRGRDHGLPPYNEYRRYCGMSPSCTWEQKPAEIDWEKWERLQDLYDKPEDIDLYVGGLSEEAERDSMLGRTFTCLVAKQFFNLKFGDRFFYTHAGPLVVFPFTDEQLENIRSRGLRDIICDNTQLPDFPESPFRLSSATAACSERAPLKVQELFSDGYENRVAFQTSTDTFAQSSNRVVASLAPSSPVAK